MTVSNWTMGVADIRDSSSLSAGRRHGRSSRWFFLNGLNWLLVLFRAFWFFRGLRLHALRGTQANFLIGFEAFVDLDEILVELADFDFAALLPAPFGDITIVLAF